MRVRFQTICWQLLAGIALALLTGRGTYYDEPLGKPPGDAAKNIDFVIEIDDEGRFRDRNVAEDALKTIGEESEKGNTIVVIFVHGRDLPVLPLNQPTYQPPTSPRNRWSTFWYFATAMHCPG
jgi:hypothetical protein